MPRDTRPAPSVAGPPAVQAFNEALFDHIESLMVEVKVALMRAGDPSLDAAFRSTPPDYDGLVSRINGQIGQLAELWGSLTTDPTSSAVLAAGAVSAPEPPPPGSPSGAAPEALISPTTGADGPSGAPRSEAAVRLAQQLSDLAFDALNVAGTVDGPTPRFGVQIDGEWFTVTVEQRHPATPPDLISDAAAPRELAAAWAALPASVAGDAAPPGTSLAHRIRAITMERDQARNNWHICHERHMHLEGKR